MSDDHFDPLSDAESCLCNAEVRLKDAIELKNLLQLEVASLADGDSSQHTILLRALSSAKRLVSVRSAEFTSAMQAKMEIEEDLTEE